MIPRDTVERVLDAAQIVDVIGDFVDLKRRGANWIACCPFHNEKSPSFYVDGQKQVYHCFGCKAGGSVIQFVMDIERLTFPEAVEFLANQLHMPLPELQNDPAYEKRRSLKERIYLANKAAARLYHQHLWQEDGADILAYVKKRGQFDAGVRGFGIGAATPVAHLGN